MTALRLATMLGIVAVSLLPATVVLYLAERLSS